MDVKENAAYPTLAIAYVQFTEVSATDAKPLHNVNELHCREAALEIYLTPLRSPSKERQRKICVAVQESVEDKKSLLPVVTISMATADEVKWRTGFADLQLLLSFVTVAGHGCCRTIVSQACPRKVTWLEEWFL